MKTFEEKLKSMTAKDVVLAMITGLEKTWVNVDMGTYGRTEGGICYGCAATNTVCEIEGKAFEPINVTLIRWQAEALAVDRSVLETFEDAVDDLRRGDLCGYNCYIEDLGSEYAKLLLSAQALDYPIHLLPCLQNSNYKTGLEFYREFANTL